jgi:PIN domain nuclease of toxin-antitoxin system
VWSFLETSKLSGNVKSILLDENNDIYYSPISLWEISIKYGLKKLFLNGGTPEVFFEEVADSFYLCTKINNDDLITSYKLPIYHKDPFDRLLIWQAIRNDFILISMDKSMESYKSEGLKVVF